MNAFRTSILGTLVALVVLSGCASIGPELSTDGSGSASSDREDILQVMERDSRAG
jgi:hypothetical protein